MSNQEISPPSGADYASNRAFADMPISAEVLEGLNALNYTMATPIQAASIDPALAGKDLVLRAKTGTGKTAAFGIPVVEKIAAGDRQTRAIVLAPTRELALQIAQELTQIARFKDLQVAAIYGGVGFGPQQQALQSGAEIVVGTPGRLLDHIKRGNLKLENVQFAVLDEADEMLSMGFIEDVRKILDRTPDSRQTLICSATLDESMKGLVARYLRDPEHILLSSDGDNVSTVAHVLYESSPDYHKARALLDLLEKERPTAAIIFCNTKEDVQTVYTYLDRQGLSAEMLTGDLPQNRREKVMARIKKGQVQYLVATDVAARGIDISDLTHVVNYALPEDAAVYLHRIGRTGRIGKTGTAISLAGGSDFSTRISLEKIHKIAFDVRPFPSPEELVKLRTDRIARMVKESSGSIAYESLLEIARGLKEHPDADVVIAAALRVFFQWDRARRIEPDDAAGGERPAEERPADDRGRDDRGRDDRGRDDRGRDDRGRDDRGRDDRRRDDRRREERPREERSREDRPREERPREERPREDRKREGRREGRGRSREAQAVDSEGSASEKTEPVVTEVVESRPEPQAEPNAEPQVEVVSGNPELDSSVSDLRETDDETDGGEDGEEEKGESGDSRKRRRRRRRSTTSRPSGRSAPTSNSGSE